MSTNTLYFNQRNNNKSSLFSFIVFLTISFIVLLLPDLVYAGGGLTGQTANITSQTQAAATIIEILAYVMGFGLVFGGFITLAVAKKQNIPASTWIMMLLVGFLLLSITVIMTIGSDTVVDGNDAAGAMNALGL